jgi:hypothetical protein
MRKIILLFILLALFLVFGAVGAGSQGKSYITVKRNDLNNGVVVVDVLREGKAYRLTCKQGMPGCASLKNGRYQMVELPNDLGMYECKDVEIYGEFAMNPEKDKKLGEFCLEER